MKNARKRSISDVFLLYLQFRYEDIDPVLPVGPSSGNGGVINIHFVRIPFIFEENSEKTYKMLRKVILDCFCFFDFYPNIDFSLIFTHIRACCIMTSFLLSRGMWRRWF